MASDLTGARLVEAVALAAEGPHQPVPATSKFTLAELRAARWNMLTDGEQRLRIREQTAAIRAQAEAAGVTAEGLLWAADDLGSGFPEVAALLRALAEVLRNEYKENPNDPV